MAGVAKLATVSTLDATKFVAGGKAMRVELGVLQSISAGAFASIGIAAAKMVGRIASILPRLAMSGFEVGDALSEAASKTGASVALLANLHRVGQLAGTSIEVIDTALTRMNVNLANAAIEGGELDKELQALGLSAKALVASGTDEAFLRIADAIAKLPDAASKSRLAVALFGREGARLVNVANLGSRGLAEEARATRALGLELTRLQATGIERAKDALDDLKNIPRGLATQLANELQPQVASLATGMKAFAVESKLAFGVASWAATGFGEMLIAVSAFIDDLSSGFKVIEKAALEIQRSNLAKDIAETKKGRSQTFELQPAVVRGAFGGAAIPQLVSVDDQVIADKQREIARLNDRISALEGELGDRGSKGSTSFEDDYYRTMNRQPDPARSQTMEDILRELERQTDLLKKQANNVPQQRGFSR